MAFRGDRRRALVPLVPIVLATGWSALVLFAVRVPLNPMSVTLGALVIAISTEFSVLLAERYRQERLAGLDTMQALRRSYERTGAAVAASGTTAIFGFGVLVLSDIRMLRDFGLVTLIDLTRVAARRARRAARGDRPRRTPRRARGPCAAPPVAAREARRAQGRLRPWTRLNAAPRAHPAGRNLNRATPPGRRRSRRVTAATWCCWRS